MTEAPAESASPRWSRGAKLALATARVLASAFLAAFLAGLMVPFLVWLFIVAGWLGLLAFFLGIAGSALALLVFAARSPNRAPSEGQSATIEGLQTGQP